MSHIPLKSKPIIGTPLRTVPSATKPAKDVDDLGLKLTNGLKIRHCKTFVNHLCRYARAESQHEPDVVYPTPTMRSSLSGDRTQNFASPPDAVGQAAALDRLGATYVALSLRTNTAVNSEAAMVVHSFRDILDLINTWLLTRYQRHGGEPTPWGFQNWYHCSAHSSRARAKAMRKSVRYPFWGPACNEDMKAGLITDWSSLAGLADIALYATPNIVAAIGEAKTPWSSTLVSDTALRYTFKLVAQSGGIYHWTSEIGPTTPVGDNASRLIRQIWGELCAANCRLGVYMDGNFVLFYARTDSNELTFSPILEWEHEQVHEALMGLSLAAVDSVLCVLRDGGKEVFIGDVRASMMDILRSICPDNERDIEVPGVHPPVPPRPEQPPPAGANAESAAPNAVPPPGHAADEMLPRPAAAPAPAPATSASPSVQPKAEVPQAADEHTGAESQPVSHPSVPLRRLDAAQRRTRVHNADEESSVPS